MEIDDHQMCKRQGHTALLLKTFYWVSGIIASIVIFYLVLSYSFSMLVRSVRGHTGISVKGMTIDIRLAMNHFKTEYDRYPVPQSESQFLRTEGVLLQSLLGQDKESNPRAIKFIDLPMALDGKHGLTGVKAKDQTISSTTTLTDLWGEKYYLLIEAHGDNRIPNPERRPEAIYKYRARAPEFLSSSVIIFSSGPDRDPKTWDDNICSWR